MLGRMFVSMSQFRKTDMVDWESRRTHEGSMVVSPWARTKPFCSKVVPRDVVVEESLGQSHA